MFITFSWFPIYPNFHYIFAMVAWFHHYQADCSHRGTHQRGETTNLLFLIGWKQCWNDLAGMLVAESLNGKSTVYWPHAGTSTHRCVDGWRVNSSGQHRRLNGELSLEWFQRDKVSHLKTQKHVKADRLGCRWRTGRNDSLMWALIYSQKISLSALFFLNVWKLLKNCPKQRKHTSF